MRPMTTAMPSEISTGDFLDMRSLAWELFRACKSAGTAFEELGHNVIALHTILKEFRDESEDRNSLFNRTGAGRTEELITLVMNCNGVLFQLSEILSEYHSLSPENKRRWEGAEHGRENLQDTGGKLNHQILSLTLFLTTPGTALLGQVELKLEQLIQDVRNGWKDEKVLSMAESEGYQAELQWSAWKSELLEEGYANMDLEDNKLWIKARLLQLVEDSAPLTESITARPSAPGGSSFSPAPTQVKAAILGALSDKTLLRLDTSKGTKIPRPYQATVEDVEEDDSRSEHIKFVASNEPVSHAAPGQGETVSFRDQNTTTAGNATSDSAFLSKNLVPNIGADEDVPAPDHTLTGEPKTELYSILPDEAIAADSPIQEIETKVQPNKERAHFRNLSYNTRKSPTFLSNNYHDNKDCLSKPDSRDRSHQPPGTRVRHADRESNTRSLDSPRNSQGAKAEAIDVEDVQSKEASDAPGDVRGLTHEPFVFSDPDDIFMKFMKEEMSSSDHGAGENFAGQPDQRSEIETRPCDPEFTVGAIEEPLAVNLEESRTQGAAPGLHFEPFVFSDPKDIFTAFMNQGKTSSDNGSGEDLTGQAGQYHKSRIRPHDSETMYMFTERALAITLEESFKGCHKKVRVQRKVNGENGRVTTRDKMLEMYIQPGSDTGSKIELRDIYDQVDMQQKHLRFLIEMKPHPIFTRDGHDLQQIVEISLKESLCGFSRVLETVDGHYARVERSLPTCSGSTDSFAGYGMPILGLERSRGDFVVKYMVKYPESLTKAQTDALRLILD